MENLKSDVIVIKEFFGMDTATAMKEIKALSLQEKQEVAALCRAEMGSMAKIAA